MCFAITSTLWVEFVGFVGMVSVGDILCSCYGVGQGWAEHETKSYIMIGFMASELIKTVGHRYLKAQRNS